MYMLDIVGPDILQESKKLFYLAHTLIWKNLG